MITNEVTVAEARFRAATQAIAELIQALVNDGKLDVVIAADLAGRLRVMLESHNEVLQAGTQVLKEVSEAAQRTSTELDQLREVRRRISSN